MPVIRGESPVTAVTNPGGFDGDIPAALLLIEAAQEKIDPGVKNLLGVLARLETGITGARRGG